MKNLSLFLAFQLLFLNLGLCQIPDPQKQTRVVEAPTKKDVLCLLMQNSNVVLKTNESCIGTAVDFTDSTLGQYLAGFWQYHADKTSKGNRLTINIKDGAVDQTKEACWIATLVLNGTVEGDPWKWGVSFCILKKDKTVLPNSFKCLEGG